MHDPHTSPIGRKAIGGAEMIRRTQQREHDTGLGARMRSRRKDLGWTQTELADKVGTSQAVIQKIENGKSLRPRILEELARALDVKPAWVFSRSRSSLCSH